MVLALALSLVAGADAAGRGVPVVLLGSRALALPIEVEVLADPAPGRPAALSWRAEGAAMVGRGGDARRAVSVRLEPADRGVALEATVHYLAAATVEREAVLLRLAGPARALGRDLAWSALERPLRVDRGTPVLVQGRDVPSPPRATSPRRRSGGPGCASSSSSTTPGHTRSPATTAASIASRGSPAARRQCASPTSSASGPWGAPSGAPASG